MKKLNEGGTPFEETNIGRQYIKWVGDSLMNDHDMSEEEVEEWTIKYEEEIGENFFMKESPEKAALDIISAIPNYIEHKYKAPSKYLQDFRNRNNECIQAKTVFETMKNPFSYTATSTYGEREPEDSWVFKPGDKVLFELNDMAGVEWDDYEQSQMAKKYDGQIASVTSQELSNGPIKTYQYYDLQFPDEGEMFAVSGYHLTGMPNN